MKKLVLSLMFLVVSFSGIGNVFASDEIQITDFVTGVGMGCYGRCGYISVTLKVKNIAYHKQVGIFFRGHDGEWRELPASYSRPLENGYEEWQISTNFGGRGDGIEFVGKYEVAGEVYWDNNDEQNFTGTLQ